MASLRPLRPCCTSATACTTPPSRSSAKPARTTMARSDAGKVRPTGAAAATPAGLKARLARALPRLRHAPGQRGRGQEDGGGEEERRAGQVPAFARGNGAGEGLRKEAGSQEARERHEA